MKAKAISYACGLSAAAVLLAACNSSGDGGGSSDGSLSLQLTDAAADEVAEIWVEIDGLRLKPQEGEVIEVPFSSALSVDMLTLTDGNTEQLLDGEPVPAGVYNWMELQVNAEFDGTYDSYVMTHAGGQEEIRVPSGSQTGLRLVSPFTITADQETSLLIDWDMRLGLADAPGQPGYLLRPAFRVIDMTEYGTLSGVVEQALITDGSCTNDPNTDSGNAVYIYEQFDSQATDPEDIGAAAEPTPVATAAVTQEDDGQHTYQTLLSPAEYTVAFTCQAADDSVDSDDDIAFVEPTDVSVTDGGTHEVNF